MNVRSGTVGAEYIWGRIYSALTHEQEDHHWGTDPFFVPGRMPRKTDLYSRSQQEDLRNLVTHYIMVMVGTVDCL